MWWKWTQEKLSNPLHKENADGEPHNQTALPSPQCWQWQRGRQGPARSLSSLCGLQRGYPLEFRSLSRLNLWPCCSTQEADPRTLSSCCSSAPGVGTAWLGVPPFPALMQCSAVPASFWVAFLRAVFREGSLVNFYKMHTDMSHLNKEIWKEKTNIFNFYQTQKLKDVKNVCPQRVCVSVSSFIHNCCC